MTKSPKLWNHFFWHVLLFGSLIFSHPLFKALNGQSEFLLAHNLEGPDLLYWIVTVGIVVNLLLVLIVFLLTQVLAPFKDQVKRTSLFILAGIFLLTLVSHWFDWGLIISLILSALLALIFVHIYGTSIYLRTFLSYTTLLVVITPVLFSFSPNVRQILLPKQALPSQGVEVPTDTNPVVVIMLDELPTLSLLDNAGNINAKRYPNLAEFSTGATWYKYATTTAEATLHSVPPILTGKVIKIGEQTLPLAANYPDNLFTLLSTTHEINAFETFTQLCPALLCNRLKPDWGLIAEDTAVIFAHITVPDALKRHLPQIDNKWVGFLRDNADSQNIHTDRDLHPHHRYKVRVEKLGWFLSELRSVSSSSVNYLHMLIPHSPWMYLPDGRVYSHAEQRSFTGTVPAGTPGLTKNKQLYSEQHLMDFIQQRHLLQTGYTDRLLGDIFSALRQRNMFDDAIIVVLSDHGVSFRPGESLREATESNSQDILSILMLIKYPGQKQPATNLRAARSIDVLPTILDVLNNDNDRLKFDGRSLLLPRESEPPTLELQRDTGEIQRFTFNDFTAEFELAFQTRNKEIFDGGFEAIYKINGQNLVNKTVQQFPQGVVVDYTLKLDNPHLYKNIDLAQNSIPTLIRANRPHQFDRPGKTIVAVAVDGTIRGMSVLQQIESVDFDFQVLVSPESFGNGVNPLGFYQVNEIGQEVTLSSIPLENVTRIEHAKTYDFSDDLQAALFAGRGWSTKSSGGARWNINNKAVLSFVVQNRETGLDLVMDSIPFFVKGAHETQTIEVSFPSGKKQVISLQRGDTGGKFVIHVRTVDIAADGTVMIKLDFPDAKSPHSLGVSNDKRLLAIKVKTIQVLTAKNLTD